MIREKLMPIVHMWKRMRYASPQLKVDEQQQIEVVPIALTSLGRSGSSIILGHLGCHPEVAVYRLFTGEVHYINYFAQVIKMLSSPNNYLYPMRSGDKHGESLLEGNAEVAAQFEPTEDNVWFKNEYIPELRTFFSGKLADIYRWKKELYHTGETNPRYVCEKFTPIGAVDVVQEVYPDMKEIVLVRDFRDVLCSVLAYNRKRGFEAFGTEQFSSTEEYVKQCLAPSADIMLQRWQKVKQQACLVHYEEFITDREKVLSRMFRYIGTDIQGVQGVMKMADRSQKEKQRNRHITSPDAVTSIARYRSELSPELIDLCNEVMKKPLQEFGYL